jgi:hypothetical protein
MYLYVLGSCMKVTDREYVPVCSRFLYEGALTRNMYLYVLGSCMKVT